MEVGLGVQAEIAGSLGGEQHVAEVAAGLLDDLAVDQLVAAAGLGVPGSRVPGLHQEMVVLEAGGDPA